MSHVRIELSPSEVNTIRSQQDLREIVVIVNLK